jgi:hypothetical protein
MEGWTMANGSTAPVLSIQTQQLIAQIISIVGMIAVGFGWLTADQVSSISTNILATIGPLMTLVGILYSLYAARKNAVVTAVAALPEVRAVVTEPTIEGRNLANSDGTPSNVVVGHPPGSPIPATPAHP